jgi:2,3-bisphosphoglycerate-independent phosphoglycerate mutase
MMFVHFHGLDDRGHDYGDMDQKTLEYIKTIDDYINELANHWDGKIIITADHGMHSTSESGSHGEFRFEDLIVPYVIIEGK